MNMDQNTNQEDQTVNTEQSVVNNENVIENTEQMVSPEQLEQTLSNTVENTVPIVEQPTMEQPVVEIQPEEQPVTNAQSTGNNPPKAINMDIGKNHGNGAQKVVKEQPKGNSAPAPANSAVNNTTPEKEVKGTKFKRILMVIIFLGLFVFIFFMPEITSFINDFLNNRNAVNEEDILSGTLSCKLSRSTENLNVNITMDFDFTERQLKTLVSSTEHNGEIGKDEAAISVLRQNCETLRDTVVNLSGVRVICSGGNATTTMNERFNYTELDPSEIGSAYAEAGGTFPEFRLNQDIGAIRQEMENANYKCETRESRR